MIVQDDAEKFAGIADFLRHFHIGAQRPIV